MYLSRGLQRPGCSLKIPNSSLPNPERGLGKALGKRQPQGLVQRGGEAWGVRNALSALPSSPLPLFERITSCYCVDREGQELGREAGLGPGQWGEKGGAKENVEVGSG